MHHPPLPHPTSASQQTCSSKNWLLLGGQHSPRSEKPAPRQAKTGSESNRLLYTCSASRPCSSDPVPSDPVLCFLAVRPIQTPTNLSDPVPSDPIPSSFPLLSTLPGTSPHLQLLPFCSVRSSPAPFPLCLPCSIFTHPVPSVFRFQSHNADLVAFSLHPTPEYGSTSGSVNAERKEAQRLNWAPREDPPNRIGRQIRQPCLAGSCPRRDKTLYESTSGDDTVDSR